MSKRHLDAVYLTRRTSVANKTRIQYAERNQVAKVGVRPGKGRHATVELALRFEQVWKSRRRIVRMRPSRKSDSGLRQAMAPFAPQESGQDSGGRRRAAP